MRTPAQRLGTLLCLSALGVGFLLPARAQTTSVPEYQIGDSATNTVTTPVILRFVDPEATEAAREEKASEVFPFFRYIAGVSNSVEITFRNAFAKTRTDFLKAVEGAHGKARFGRLEISDEALGRTRAEFQKSNSGFPVTPELARDWASGGDGLSRENQWAERLRQATSKVIRPSGAWSGSGVTAKDVRLLTVEAVDETVSLYNAERQCRLFRRSTMVPLNRARQELEDSFPPAEREVAKYLAALVQPNCEFDAALTREASFPKTNDLWAYSQIEAGETVIEAGQTVDARTKAALDELRRNKVVAAANSEVAQARAEVATVRSNAAEATESAVRLAEEVERVRAESAARQREIIRWGGVAFCVLGVAALGIWWKVLRRRPRSSSGRRSGALPLVKTGSAQPAVASSTMPYAMRRMLHERGTLVACQQQAETEINRFEERLLELQLPFNERLRAYEDRIADLERQLASRTEENRELINAAIDSTRRKLDAVRRTRSVSAN